MGEERDTGSGVEGEDYNSRDVRISVNKELADHYKLILQMRDDLLADTDADPKAVIQVMNSTTGILKDLGKLQEDLYNSETTAILQQVVLSCLREADEKFQQKVIEIFKERLAMI